MAAVFHPLSRGFVRCSGRSSVVSDSSPLFGVHTKCVVFVCTDFRLPRPTQGSELASETLSHHRYHNVVIIVIVALLFGWDWVGSLVAAFHRNHCHNAYHK